MRRLRRRGTGKSSKVQENKMLRRTTKIRHVFAVLGCSYVLCVVLLLMVNGSGSDDDYTR